MALCSRTLRPKGLKMKDRVAISIVAALALVAMAAPAQAHPHDTETPAAKSLPYTVAADFSVGIGLFFATHAKLALAVGRRLWNRVDVEVALRLGAASDLLIVEPTVTASLLLHLSPRWNLVLGWRAGYASFRVIQPTGRTFWTGGAAMSAMVGATFAIRPNLELRIMPAAVTGYWNDLWGMLLEPAVGLGYRF